jgi:hypothetical protein
MKTRFNHFALAACLTVHFAYLGMSPCFGQGSIYFDRGAFDLAISGLSGIRNDVNFVPPFPPGGMVEGGEVYYLGTVDISGLTFRGGGPLFLRVSSSAGNYFLNNWDSIAPLAVDMNGPALAFGADFSSYLSSVNSFQATVTLNDGRVFTFTAPAVPNSTFFGFVTTQPFSSLTFSDGGLIGLPPPLHEESLDNITVVTVPEPGVIALLALGALFLGWWLRRK